VHDRDKKEVSDRAKFKQSEMLTPDCAGRDAKHTSCSMQQRQERRQHSVGHHITQHVHQSSLTCITFKMPNAIVGGPFGTLTGYGARVGELLEMLIGLRNIGFKTKLGRPMVTGLTDGTPVETPIGFKTILGKPMTMRAG
jgi:hypothetical protein